MHAYCIIEVENKLHLSNSTLPRLYQSTLLLKHSFFCLSESCFQRGREVLSDLLFNIIIGCTISGSLFFAAAMSGWLHVYFACFSSSSSFLLNNLYILFSSAWQGKAKYPLRASLFPKVAPTIRFFAPADEKEVIPLPSGLRNHLRWKLTSITPIIVRETVRRSGYRITTGKLSLYSFFGDDFDLLVILP